MKKKINFQINDVCKIAPAIVNWLTRKIIIWKVLRDELSTSFLKLFEKETFQEMRLQKVFLRRNGNLGGLTVGETWFMFTAVQRHLAYQKYFLYPLFLRSYKQN